MPTRGRRGSRLKRIDIVTLFPEMFESVFSQSIVGRAVKNGLVDIHICNFRDYAHDKHRTVDDCPYGGGPGMVLKPEPLFEAVEAVITESEKHPDGAPVSRRVVLMTPQGKKLTQEAVERLSGCEHLVLVCGHYEGVDERIREHLVSDEISIGDYVLSGGELASMVVVDAVVRLVPGALGCAESGVSDSFSSGLLQYPQYTRPPVFRDWSVPEVLLSGNHAEIERWRKGQSLKRTVERRPDLVEGLETPVAVS